MSDDILHRYKCSGCTTSTLGFSQPTDPCPTCNSLEWRRFDTANVASTTAGLFGAQYDSLNTIDQDVAAYTEQDELEKDWKKIDEVRRS